MRTTALTAALLALLLATSADAVAQPFHVRSSIDGMHVLEPGHACGSHPMSSVCIAADGSSNRRG
jgi:hypothetical protein